MSQPDRSMPVALRLDVALVPEMLESSPASAHSVYIVIDVIRATTTLSVLFEQGCQRVLIAPSIPAAREARARTAEPQPLLAGESGGVAPGGFDFGNSPAEVGTRDLRGRELIFVTTNGTRALHACQGGGAILTGAYRNARAVIAAALALALQLNAPLSDKPLSAEQALPAGAASEAAVAGEHFPGIVIVCSGRGRIPAYDDTLCAGDLAREALRQANQTNITLTLSEGALLALAVAGDRQRRAQLRDQLAISAAAAAVRRVGLIGDLDWCAAENVATVVPRVTGSEHGLLVVEASAASSPPRSE